jgi:hypothetical protein
MGKISIQEAIENMAYNHALARKYPENQKEFETEHFYSDPHNYDEMLELYTAYGYKYSPSLWAYQQMVYQQADEQTKERLAQK